MNRKEREFESAFGAAFRALDATKGRCPSTEELATFLSGGHGGDEGVRRHVAACGACEAIVERMRLFDEPAASARRPRLRVPFAGAMGRFVLHPAVAYALAAVVVFIAIVAGGRVSAPGVATRLPAVAAPAAMSSATVVDLNQARGGGAAAPPGGDTLILTFTVPVQPGHRYVARLLDGSGRALEETPLSGCDALGNCQLVVRPRLLRGIAQTLRVTEHAGSAAAPSRQFDFPLPF